MALTHQILHDCHMASTALTGKRILLTRAAQQNIQLEQIVLKRAALPVLFPCLEIQTLDDSLESGLPLLKECGDVLFTSANAVQSLAELLRPDKRLAEQLDGKRIAAVGAQTAAALVSHGINIDLIPDVASQDGLITAYREAGIPKQGLLFFRAEEGRDRLIKELRQEGVRVALVPAYRTICPEGEASEVVEMLNNNCIDAVLLGSPKAARHYRRMIADIELANRPVIAVISEKLAQAARAEGLNVQVVAKDASFDSILDALAEFFESTKH